MNNRAVFLDRDGTIIEDVDYLSDPDEIKLINGSIEGIKILNKMGFKTVIVTNQSGVARGFFTEDTVRLINNRLIEILKNRGAVIDGVYYCPHHPESSSPQYGIDCECRKPKTGMLESAASDLGIDLKGSYIIGDKAIDIELANRAGGTGILVKTGYGPKELSLAAARQASRPGFVAENLYDAALWIMKVEFGV